MMETVPFSIHGLFGGIAEAEGIARLEPETLVLEFRFKDSVAGLILSSVKEVRLPLTEITGVRLEKNVFWKKISGARLIIQARSMKTVEAVPSNRPGEIRLHLSEEAIPAAEQLVAKCRPGP